MAKYRSIQESELIAVTWNQGELINSLAANTKFAVTTNCGDIMFINQGTVTVYINNMPLPAGASITFGCNQGEINVANMYVTSPTPISDAGVWVFRKSYK